MIGLCSSLTNSRIVSIFTAPPANLFGAAKVFDHAHLAGVLELEDFLSKIFKPLKQDSFDIHHVSDF